MEQIVEFLRSENGKFICYIVLFAGVSDFLIARMVFGKMLKDIESKMLQQFSLSERESLQVNAVKMRGLIKIFKVSGVVFVAFAIFGLMM